MSSIPPRVASKKKTFQQKGGGSSSSSFGGGNNKKNKNNASTTTTTNDVYIQNKNGSMKFIGGAAMARRTAITNNKKKPKGNRILRPGERFEGNGNNKHNGQLLPPGLSPFERFCAGLLRCEMVDFVNITPKEQWKVICQRFNLPVPNQPLPACYENSKLHFVHRAALVVEEARHSIADGVMKIHRRCNNNTNTILNNNNMNNNDNKKFQQQKQSKQQQRPRRGGGGQNNNNNKYSTNTMLLTVEISETKDKTGHTSICFTKHNGPFTSEEISNNLRQGTVFALLNRSLSPKVSNMVLGCILPGNREEMIQSRSFTVIVFRKISVMENSKWDVTPISSLLSEQRKFEACTSSAVTNVPFLIPLLGGKERKHTRFTQDSDGNTIPLIKSEEEDTYDDDDSIQCILPSNNNFRLKTLNRTQEKAAKMFLQSEPNTITLVQGPPGTGKTTLTTSVICRYVMESIEENLGRTLMVCAPTNKAVAVICTRFLDAVGEDRPCNIVLVGDDDKLLDDDYNRKPAGESRSSLRSVFLYTWIGTVLDDYTRIKRLLNNNGRDKDFRYMSQLSRRVETRVQRSLGEYDPTDLLSSTLVETMQNVSIGLERDPSLINDATILLLLEQIDQIISIVRTWKSDHVWRGLLSSAHIVFCTLASAGTGIVKKSISEVDDLIVDEAASSSEAEMYIPFVFRPKRLLAVGDPKQLPATVVSPMADELGMSRSLHERLMYDCGHTHIMLDLQYRMKPELSNFPSRIFYDDKLLNGSNVCSPEYQGSVKVMHGQQYSFLQVNGSERQAKTGSFENYAEAQKVVDIIQQIRQASNGSPGRWNSSDRVRVITFYQAQVSLIKRLLHNRRLGDTVVATVDSSQGCEADIVIISFVRSHGPSGRNTVGFLSDDRRMNVALTRAKYQMICIGNITRMLNLQHQAAATVKMLAEDAMERNCVVGLRPSQPSMNMSDRSEMDPRAETKKRKRREKKKRDKPRLSEKQPLKGGENQTETVSTAEKRKKCRKVGNNASPQQAIHDGCQTTAPINGGAAVKAEESADPMDAHHPKAAGADAILSKLDENMKTSPTDDYMSTNVGDSNFSAPSSFPARATVSSYPARVSDCSYDDAIAFSDEAALRTDNIEGNIANGGRSILKSDNEDAGNTANEDAMVFKSESNQEDSTSKTSVLTPKLAEGNTNTNTSRPYQERASVIDTETSLGRIGSKNFATKEEFLAESHNSAEEYLIDDGDDDDQFFVVQGSKMMSSAALAATGDPTRNLNLNNTWKNDGSFSDDDVRESRCNENVSRNDDKEVIEILEDATPPLCRAQSPSPPSSPVICEQNRAVVDLISPEQQKQPRKDDTIMYMTVDI